MGDRVSRIGLPGNRTNLACMEEISAVLAEAAALDFVTAFQTIRFRVVFFFIQISVNFFKIRPFFLAQPGSLCYTIGCNNGWVMPF